MFSHPELQPYVRLPLFHASSVLFWLALQRHVTHFASSIPHIHASKQSIWSVVPSSCILLDADDQFISCRLDIGSDELAVYSQSTEPPDGFVPTGVVPTIVLLVDLFPADSCDDASRAAHLYIVVSSLPTLPSPHFVLRGWLLAESEYATFTMGLYRC
jgi:hypothetical protein